MDNRELLAIHLALGEWRQWLESSYVPFIVWTDHRNLEYIHSAKRLNARQARWAFILFFLPVLTFLFPTDALSRLFDSSEVTESRTPIIPKGHVISAAVWGIERLVKRALSHSITPRQCPGNLLFIPASAHLAVLQWAHSSKLAAHPVLGALWLP